MIKAFCFIYSASYVCDVFNINSGFKRLCYLYNRMFAHSVRYNVCSGIYENRMFYLIRPVIIMRHSSERTFYTTYNYGSFLICLSYKITVYNSCIIRTHAHFATWRICIILSVLFINCIMINH